MKDLEISGNLEKNMPDLDLEGASRSTGRPPVFEFCLFISQSYVGCKL